MKKLFTILFLTLPVMGFTESDLPEGTIQKGTLTNQKLLYDAMVGVAAEVATLGCQYPVDLDPFVVAIPQGDVGERVWREMWLVNGCDTQFPISITFREDGLGAATWVVEKRANKE